MYLTFRLKMTLFQDFNSITSGRAEPKLPRQLSSRSTLPGKPTRIWKESHASRRAELEGGRWIVSHRTLEYYSSAKSSSSRLYCSNKFLFEKKALNKKQRLHSCWVFLFRWSWMNRLGCTRSRLVSSKLKVNIENLQNALKFVSETGHCSYVMGFKTMLID